MRQRAITPAVGVVLLVGIAVGLGVVLTVTLSSVGVDVTPSFTVLSASADATTDKIILRHTGGPPVDVREIDVRVSVDGEPLERQPPVPYFAAAGFVGAPTGPFNQAADPVWEPDERVSFRIAGTNTPTLHRGDQVTVALYRGEMRVAVAETTAQ